MKLRIPYLLATVVAIAACLYLADTSSLKAAPLINIKTLSGDTVDLALPEGRTRLITFWAPDCPISERNIPALNRLQEQFSGEAFEILAVAMPYVKASDVTAFLQKNDISYQIAHDLNGEMSDSFPGVRFTPTSFLINSESNIIWKQTGRMTADRVALEILSAIKPQQLAKR